MQSPARNLRRTSIGRSDIGLARLTNEDAFFRDDELGLYIVADGMGGHAAGEVASAEAIDAVIGMVRRGSGIIAAVDDGSEAPTEEVLKRVQRLFESAVQAATYMVYGLADLEPDQHGMGTTISALLVSGEHAWIAHVGDSRIYHVRHGVTSQVTEDHTLTAWQVRQGLISAEEALFSPHRNVITRAVGNREYVQVDTSVWQVRPGDRFVLCSDGLHGALDDDEIAPIVQAGGARAVKRFIDLANERGGRDNITCILVELE